MLILCEEDFHDHRPDKSYSIFSAEAVAFPTRCLEQLRRGHVQLSQDLWGQQRKLNDFILAEAKGRELVNQQEWVELVTAQLEQLESDIREMSSLRDAAIEAVVEFKTGNPNVFRPSREEVALEGDNHSALSSAQADWEVKKLESNMVLS